MESTNNVLENILTKIVSSHRKDCTERLPEALWAYITTWRNAIGYSPYELVYGKIPLFPIEFEIKTLRIAMEVGLNPTAAQKHQLKQLNASDEIRLAAIENIVAIQQQRTKWHDKYIKKKVF